MKRTNSKDWLWTISVGLAFIVFVTFTARPGNTSPKEDSRIAPFIAALEADGFTVREGTVETANAMQADNNQVIDSAFTN